LPVNDLQSQVIHWDTTCAVTTRALHDADKRVTERQQTLTSNQQRKLQLQKRLDELSSSANKLVEDKNNLKSQEKELAEQSSHLRIRIDPLSIELSEVEKKYENGQSLEITAQQALTVAERYFTQAQLDNTRQREVIDNLRRRIEDDMGLVALEYEKNVSGPTPLPFDGLVDQLPMITELSSAIDESIARQRSQLRRMGAVNFEAQSEFKSVLERYQFMSWMG
jgi:chromosome segregation protein